jgi:hypothetical protein
MKKLLTILCSAFCLALPSAALADTSVSVSSSATVSGLVSVDASVSADLALLAPAAPAPSAPDPGTMHTNGYSWD